MALKPLKDNWHCPYCGGEDTFACVGLCEDTETQCSQGIKCITCGKKWREVYKLAGWIENWEGGDQDGDIT